MITSDNIKTIIHEDLACEIRIPSGVDVEKITNPFRILGFEVRKIGSLADGSSIYEVVSKPTVR